MFYEMNSKVKWDNPKKGMFLKDREVIITGTIKELNGEECYTFRYEDDLISDFFIAEKKFVELGEDYTVQSIKSLGIINGEIEEIELNPKHDFRDMKIFISKPDENMDRLTLTTAVMRVQNQDYVIWCDDESLLKPNPVPSIQTPQGSRIHDNLIITKVSYEGETISLSEHDIKVLKEELPKMFIKDTDFDKWLDKKVKEVEGLSSTYETSVNGQFMHTDLLSLVQFIKAQDKDYKNVFYNTVEFGNWNLNDIFQTTADVIFENLYGETFKEAKGMSM